jgi:sugar/nucleoside kinase (ribokinase family)
VPGRIACVGEVMLDVFVATAARHGTIRVRAGGTPVNVARAIGPGSIVIGRVGADAAAAAIRHELRDLELRLAADPSLPTGTFVELADGSVFADRGANAALALDDVLPLDADTVLLSGYVALPVLERLDARWRAFVCTPTTSAVPDAANVVFANDEESSRLDLSGREIVVVTHGPGGATIHRGGKAVRLGPSGDTETGAGDRLAGRFLASLRAGEP